MRVGPEHAALGPCRPSAGATFVGSPCPPHRHLLWRPVRTHSLSGQYRPWPPASTLRTMYRYCTATDSCCRPWCPRPPRGRLRCTTRWLQPETAVTSVASSAKRRRALSNQRESICVRIKRHSLARSTIDWPPRICVDTAAEFVCKGTCRRPVVDIVESTFHTGECGDRAQSSRFEFGGGDNVRRRRWQVRAVGEAFSAW
jgi:hypothetical protein